MSSDNNFVKKILEEVAKENDMKEFEIIYKNIPFTGDNYCGDISQVQIKPLDSKQKKISLFLKAAPADPEIQKNLPTKQIFEDEILLYSEVLPALYGMQEEYKIPQEERFRYAKYYKGISEELNSLIVMEDLSAEGFVLRDKRSPLDLDHITLVLKNLARFHATSFALKKHNPILYSKYNINKIYIFKEFALPMFKIMAANLLKSMEFPRHKTRIELFLTNIEEHLDYALDANITEPYNVVIHGDAWSNNMLFKYQNNKIDKTVLVDWPVSRLSTPAADIAYVFCMSTDLNLLNNNMEQMLDIYYETLQQATLKMDCDINLMFPKEILKEHVRNFMPFALCIAVTGLPLALSEPKDAKSIGSVMDTSQKPMVVSERASKRIVGLLDYFVKNDLIA